MLSGNLQPYSGFTLYNGVFFVIIGLRVADTSYGLLFSETILFMRESISFLWMSRYYFVSLTPENGTICKLSVQSLDAGSLGKT